MPTINQRHYYDNHVVKFCSSCLTWRPSFEKECINCLTAELNWYNNLITHQDIAQIKQFENVRNERR
jgi:hypothetical protein